MSDKIDVLAVMALAGEALEHSELIERKSITRTEVDNARDAVANLVQADRAFDVSQRHLTEAKNATVNKCRVQDGHLFVSLANAQHSFDRAVDARRAALAKVQP